MHNKSYKKAVVFAICLTMLMPLGSMVVSSTDESSSQADSSAAVKDTDSSVDSAADDTSSADASDAAATADESSDKAAEDSAADEKTTTTASKDDEVQPITDEEALAMCEKITENDKIALYLDEENERLCLYVKASGKYWWTSPINVQADQTIIDTVKGTAMKNAQRKQIAASAAIRVGDLRQEKRTESPAPVYSNKAKVKWQKNSDGVVATYNYVSDGVKLKIHYVLEDDNLYVYCDSDEIEEKNTSQVDGKVLTKIEFCPNFGAADSTATGYMIVPDGSGAVINYNNGKTEYADYNQQVFGRDYTAVPITAPRTTQQAYMPVLATVSGSSGLVCVASDGESNVYAEPKVSSAHPQQARQLPIKRRKQRLFPFPYPPNAVAWILSHPLESSVLRYRGIMPTHQRRLWHDGQPPSLHIQRQQPFLRGYCEASPQAQASLCAENCFLHPPVQWHSCEDVV